MNNYNTSIQGQKEITELKDSLNSQQQHNTNYEGTASSSPRSIEATSQKIVVQNSQQEVQPIQSLQSQQLTKDESLKEWTKHFKTLPSGSKWGENEFNLLKKMIELKLTGEECMKALVLKRRKDLESLLYKLSSREKQFYSVVWETDYDNGDHALPDLRIGKDGLRLSNVRLKRHGINVPEGSYFRVEKLEEKALKLTFS